jgi:hypothetical protein
MQKLGACIDDSATLDWSKKCVDKNGNPTPDSTTETQHTKIPCGKVASPLPFFDMLNLIAVAIFLSIYYFSIRNKKIR